MRRHAPWRQRCQVEPLAGELVAYSPALLGFFVLNPLDVVIVILSMRGLTASEFRLDEHPCSKGTVLSREVDYDIGFAAGWIALAKPRPK